MLRKLVVLACAGLALPALGLAPLEVVPEIRNGTVNLQTAEMVADDIRGIGLAAAPQYHSTLLKPGDRLAICGDSITEQKMYSRLIEDYLVMCAPQFGVTVRQYGWGGERAPGFLARMTNDCLRFKPTIATTCYGMNDHEYRAYEDRIGNTYISNSLAIIRAFKANGARVVHGSPGCVGKLPGWIKQASGYHVRDLNSNLAQLRNLGIELADEENVRFADVYAPMLVTWRMGQLKNGDSYAIPGSDGVHPGWAGQTVMAYAFLSALGLDGEIGTITLDMERNAAKASKGHEIVSAANGTFTIRSSKYPFCFVVPTAQKEHSYPVAASDRASSHDSMVSVLRVVPFNEELNRLTLRVNNAPLGLYRVTWGDQTRHYTSAVLKEGVNLASDFLVNPFSEAFSKVDAAVYAKQAYETQQIKKNFHSPEAKADMEEVVKRTEAERAPLAKAITDSFQPVTHTLQIKRVQ